MFNNSADKVLKKRNFRIKGPLTVSDKSQPFNAAHRQYLPIDLKARGYVEEEFIINGLANVYEWFHSDNNPATIRTDAAPYTTRILVRRPRNPVQFSGNVIVEVFNWSRGYDTPWGGWAESYDYFLSHRDVWVGITIRPAAIEGLKKFNPARYSELSMANPLPFEQRCRNPGGYATPSSPESEDGLAWDIISQVGMLVRGKAAGNPLAGYKVEYVYATGATGGDLSAYVSAIHPLASAENGRPVFDGYVIKCTGSPGCINQCEPRIPPQDPRCKCYIDVPVIRIMTQGDILGVGSHPDWSWVYRQPDSDNFGEQYRLYEVPGSCVKANFPRLCEPCKEDILAAGGKWEGPVVVSENELPLRFILNGAFANIDTWVRRRIAPPRAERLETKGEYPDMHFVLDEFRNIKGGLRTPYVDVPVATYSADDKIIPFDRLLLLELYPSHAEYFRRVSEQSDELVRKGWISETDAIAIKQNAAMKDFSSEGPAG